MQLLQLAAEYTYIATDANGCSNQWLLSTRLLLKSLLLQLLLSNPNVLVKRIRSIKQTGELELLLSMQLLQ
jgi:hypothetical protein